jgi:two-component system sensor histidine kinase/response regulator
MGSRAVATRWLEDWFERVVATDDADEALAWTGEEAFALSMTDAGTDEGMRFIRLVCNTRPQLTIAAMAPADAATLFELIELNVVIIPSDAPEELVLDRLHSALTSAQDRRRVLRSLARLEHEVQIRAEELLEAQGQIVRLQEARDNMLALVSHEIRTPLNGILGFLDLLRSPELAADVPAFLTYVEDSAHRLERSTRKALDFASLSTGLKSGSRQLHQVSALLEAARGQVDRHHTLPVTLQGDQLLETDGELVIQIVRNLLENTLKYGGASPRVTISLVRDGRWDVLRYSDNGPGFPEVLLTNLFQPFATGGILHHAEGMGLGLALIDVIMLTLGGRVEGGNAPEGGAFVTLRFPVSATPV